MAGGPGHCTEKPRIQRPGKFCAPRLGHPERTISSDRCTTVSGHSAPRSSWETSDPESPVLWLWSLSSQPAATLTPSQPHTTFPGGGRWPQSRKWPGWRRWGQAGHPVRLLLTPRPARSAPPSEHAQDPPSTLPATHPPLGQEVASWSHSNATFPASRWTSL